MVVVSIVLSCLVVVVSRDMDIVGVPFVGRVRVVGLLLVPGPKGVELPGRALELGVGMAELGRVAVGVVTHSVTVRVRTSDET